MAGPTAIDPASDLAGADKVNMGFISAIVAVATIGGFMFGYDSGVINGTQDGLESAFNLSALGTGFNVGAILLGCAFGAFAAGRLADLIGRRTVMLIAAVMFIISAIWAGAADTSANFIIARFIGGLGVGAASVLSPVYISEVTPAAIRGRLSSVQQIMIITGLTGRRIHSNAVARFSGLAMDVLAPGHSRRHFPLRTAADPRKPALSGCEGQRRRGGRRAEAPVRTRSRAAQGG
jgi:SP family sugar:H+ symporter-like MFS transporter